MSFRGFRTQVAIVLASATVACGGGGGGSNPPPLPPPPPLQSQTISFAQQGPLVLRVGATATNAASGGAGTGAITYQSSDTNVLTVNATSGVATGVAIGAGTVTATKAADATFAQAQATYTVSVQTTATMSAWIGATNGQVTLPQIAVGKQFVRAPVETCATPENVVACPNAQSSAVAAPAVTDTTATLTRPAYYSLTAGSVAAAPSVVAAPWGPRWFHQAVVFNGAMWVIDGAPSLGPTSTDVWPSTDGVSWTKQAGHAPMPSQRWPM